MKVLAGYIIAFVALVCSGLSAAAQEPVEIVGARFEPDSVLLGDHFDLVLEVVSDSSVGVAFPVLEGGIADGRIELLQERGIDTVKQEGTRYHLRKRWRMTSFEPAAYSLDSLGLLWTDGTKVDTLYSAEPLTLQVGMMPVDTAQKTIYDIKQPLPAPLKFGEIGGYAFSALGVLAVVALVVLLIIRRLRKKEGEQQKPSEPAHIVAIRQLEILSNQKLWQNGKIKEYYSRLTEILRGYLEGRFGVCAMEMTTDEIVVALRGLSLTPKHLQQLGALLAESDLVKFAKYHPSEESHEEYYNIVYYFVEESKEVAEEVVTSRQKDIQGVVITEGGEDE